MPSKQERQSAADSSKMSFNVLGNNVKFHFHPSVPNLLGFALHLAKTELPMIFTVMFVNGPSLASKRWTTDVYIKTIDNYEQGLEAVKALPRLTKILKSWSKPNDIGISLVHKHHESTYQVFRGP
jgi:hypothetical protein